MQASLRSGHGAGKNVLEETLKDCSHLRDGTGKNMVSNRRGGFLFTLTVPPSASPSNLQNRARRYACWMCYPALAGFMFQSFALNAHAQSGLPDGPGKAVVERMCTTCHGLNVVTGQRMTKQHWADQVDDMV